MSRIIALLLLVSVGIINTIPFTANDIHQLYRLSNAVVSPKGDYIVQEVRKWNNSTGKTSTFLQVNSFPNTALYQVILPNSTSANYYNPVFSNKHFNTLFFLSDLDGSTQIYSIDFPPAKNSTPVKLSNYEIDIDNLKVVGHSLAFSAEVYLDCPDFNCTRNRDNEIKKRGPNTYHTYDKLFVRHWDKWMNDKFSHIFVHQLHQNSSSPVLKGYPKDIMKGLEANSPVYPDGDSSHFDVSPNESEGMFNCHFRSKDEAYNTSWRLFRVKLDNDTEPQHVARKFKGRVVAPQYSPDGKKVAFLAMDTPGVESDKLYIEIYDLETKVSKNVTGFFDRTVNSFSWLDNDTLIFTSTDFGVNKLYRVDIHFPTSSMIDISSNLPGYQNSSFNSIIKGPSIGNTKTFVFSVNSFVRPDFLAVLNFTSILATVVNEIDLNSKSLQNYEIPKVESILFNGGHDDIVQAWIMYPNNFNSSAKYPLAYLIHGGPEASWISSFSYRWNPLLWASRGYAVVMVNFHGSVGQGQAYINSVRGDMGGVPYDDLMKGLSFIKLKYQWIDTTRACAAGGSYGGYMVNLLQGKTDIFKCFVTHDGDFNEVGMFYSTDELWFPMTDNCPNNSWGCSPWDPNFRSLYEKHSPESYVSNWKTPHLVIHGGNDYRIPITEALSVFTALQLKNIPSRLLYFTEENHWVLKPENSIKWYEEVLNWFDKYAKAK